MPTYRQDAEIAAIFVLLRFVNISDG